ncbi:Periplasmic protein TonB, links inner and outer membrane [Candidatus Burkholderia brachyanthoides]|nr:Periplasmic protein TonB, links inner and outer membrane [Candidatus Burkholderia brachyanthoides]
MRRLADPRAEVRITRLIAAALINAWQAISRVHATRLATTSLPVLAAVALSACGLLPTQPAAPIVEHSYIPLPAETETEAPETEEPASTPAVPEPASAPKFAPKPKRKIVKPKPPEPPPPPPPPPEPPEPPQIISTRLMQHEQLHGLLDAEVQRPDGKVVGRAVDMYVDASSKPKLLMVNLAGFMGVGDRKVNFPWSAFKFTPNSKTPITFASPAPAAKGKSADPVPKPLPVNETPPNLLQLVDSTVAQKNGARIGHVVDVLVDAQGEPQALVLDLSTSLAEDKRHIAANWGDLHVVMRNKQETLQIDFNEAQLKASSTYATDQPIKIVSPVVSAPASATSAASAPVAASGASAPATASAASGDRRPQRHPRPRPLRQRLQRRRHQRRRPRRPRRRYRRTVRRRPVRSRRSTRRRGRVSPGERQRITTSINESQHGNCTQSARARLAELLRRQRADRLRPLHRVVPRGQ